MMRHAIPPTRFFSQTPNDLIRHPRLNGTAVRLLQWALSLPGDSRETLQSIGEKMPEGRIALRRARQQLEAEGFVHTRRSQCPRTGRWTTRVLVSNVALRTAEEIEAAFAPPGDRMPTVGAPAGRAVGTSPKGKNTDEVNTPHPAAPLVARAAAVLHRVGRMEARLALGVAEAAGLAPLAARWLANGASELELRTAVTAGLPTAVHSPAGFIARRLRDKLPAPRTCADPAAPAAPLPECPGCGDPLPRGQATGVCTPCTGAVPLPVPAAVPAPGGPSGAERVRAALAVARPAPRA
ncbi:hypothetical protein [Streptomyces sp. MI02-7b]|uniref:hypothetical protein n=1 Tax=Streptomyces sp. MI02-7b TaxID=462941 RepID=UPI0029AC2863|nr:hypothetical protein [Streptomyces sp. MI02-7b]MDX3075986.1 hypothetical protein [Streptomyces sp. MI02-7b]